MSQEYISTDVKIKGGNIKIKATHNKKFQSALLFIEFDTSQKNLLNLLLQKYSCEKRLFTGINMNNGIYSSITGENSILMIVPENKITQNISLLYAYISKTHLTSQQAKLCGSGDYKKLSSEVKEFNVIVTGKCKNFINALKNNAPKIVNMVNQINAITPKDRDNINVDKVDSCIGKTITIDNLSNEAMLYLSICMEDIPCKISKDKLTLLSKNALERLEEKMMWKDTFQGKVKSFLNQTGAVGSPSANDTGGKKFKAKSDMILTCENVLASIFSKLRGFNYSFDDVSELKKVNSEAMNKVKSLKLKIN